MLDRPWKIENAPGLTWRKYKHQWEARWQPRHDLRRKGFPIAVHRLWLGPMSEFNEAVVALIQERCQSLQDEMIGWSRGAFDEPAQYDKTVSSLIHHYKTDKLSKYHKLRYVSRLNYDSVLKRLDTDMGKMPLAEIKARQIHEFHQQWMERGKVMAHSVIGMLRTITGYGLAYLECDECERLSVVLSKMRFEMGKPRSVFLTNEQCEAIRAEAHAAGWHSVALGQAFQFYGIMRQKDVIGEYVPLSEPVITDHIFGNAKWARGIQWQEIDAGLVLRHMTSKRQKPLNLPLRGAPELLDELARMAGVSPVDLTRAHLPASGPIILNDKDGLPWTADSYRRIWRAMADRAGVPKGVYNMDSRAGGISEAVEAGAPLEHVRHAATHSNITTTQGYDRGGEANTVNVMNLRANYRTKKGT